MKIKYTMIFATIYGYKHMIMIQSSILLYDMADTYIDNKTQLYTSIMLSTLTNESDWIR